MSSEPLQPARIDWEGEAPFAPDFGDVYHARAGAQAQARHVFLGGNQLPQRWQGRQHFVVLETGFGLGNNFLATWRAWRDDPQRCDRLIYVAAELHPPSVDDLRRAHREAVPGLAELAQALAAAWPPLLGGVHQLLLDGARMELQLLWSDVAQALRHWRGRADAFFLDGFSPSCNPAMWSPPLLKSLGRLAAPHATAATWSVARPLRDALTATGFDVTRSPGFGRKRQMTTARFAPRPSMRFAPSLFAFAVRPGRHRRALVIGAGLAGAACAQALRRRGFAVEVLDRATEPAAGASGNPAGLFHGVVIADGSVHARLLRTAALMAARRYRPLIDSHAVDGRIDGLLRLETRLDIAAMRSLADRQGLPADYVQPLDAAAAAQAAGVALSSPAWLYPHGGWLDPGALVRHWLGADGITWRGDCAAHALRRGADGWLAVDADGHVLACADAVVLANGSDAPRLAASAGADASALERALRHERGQLSLIAAAPGLPRPRRPLAGDGYAIALPDGRLLCGATAIPLDGGVATPFAPIPLDGGIATPFAPIPPDGGVAAPHAVPGITSLLPLQAADHEFNLQRLVRLVGELPQDTHAVDGRAAVRVGTRDRLPLAGFVATPTAVAGPGRRLNEIDRLPSLVMCCGLGGRGITWAPLLGELVAAQLEGLPLPLEGGLVDALDPARFALRAARQMPDSAPPPILQAAAGDEALRS